MEMICIVCNKTIQRGHRFVGSRYKTIKFCCENCYNQYCQQKDEEKASKAKAKAKEPYPGWRDLTDYINEIYPSNTINWPMFVKQIKSILEEYNVSCDDIRRTIKYAIEFEDYVVNPEWGIGQFFPKYFNSMKQFREQININRIAAKRKDEIPVFTVKRQANTNRFYNRKVEDFDEV